MQNDEQLKKVLENILTECQILIWKEDWVKNKARIYSLLDKALQELKDNIENEIL